MYKIKQLILLVIFVNCNNLFSAGQSTILGSINNREKTESVNQKVFFHAIKHAVVNIVREFIHLVDVDVNIKDNDGNTPLMVAANYPQSGQLAKNFDEIAKIILNSRKVNGNLENILDLAKKNNRIELLKLITYHQSRILLVDDMPDLMLPANNHHEIASMLMGAGSIDVSEPEVEMPNQVNNGVASNIANDTLVEREAMIAPRSPSLCAKLIVTIPIQIKEHDIKRLDSSKCIVS